MAARCSSLALALRASVDAAREWVHARTLTGGRIVWKEDVHHCTQGAVDLGGGGFGVFDPGINALSVLTEVLATSSASRSPCWRSENQQAAYRRDGRMRTEGGVTVEAEFDLAKRASRAGISNCSHHRPLRNCRKEARRLRSTARSSRPIEAWRGSTHAFTHALRRCARRPGPKWTGGPFQLVADAFLIGERRIVAPHRCEKAIPGYSTGLQAGEWRVFCRGRRGLSNVRGSLG